MPPLAADTGFFLALNAGSSSLKFGLFAPGGDGDPALLARGQVDGIGSTPHLTAKDASSATIAGRDWGEDKIGPDGITERLLGWIEDTFGRRLLAVGHRIVHGGSAFAAPVRLTPKIVDALDALTPLAPLHQPLGLAPVRVLSKSRPELPQVACFDTAFHHDLRPPVSRYAIPRRFEELGVRRYGFHGLSYEFIAARLAELSPDLPDKRTIVAHLGNGASLCAMQYGRSLDTTMGFSALDGLVMGTRCGAIDPGVLLYLQQQQGLSVKELEQLLYHESGLLGVSGISGDLRTLLASPEPHAAEAVELFAFRVARDAAALANTLGGLECLVFTGGIGEHAAPIRAMVAERLGWLGAALDEAANQQAADLISAADSKIDLRIIPTNEEMMIARHMAEALASDERG